MLHRLAVAGVVLALAGGAVGTASAAGTTPAQQCAAARELSRLGRDADAQALYLQLVQEDYKCEGTTAALHPDWPRRVTQFVSAWWSFALYSALVAGLGFALLTRYRPVRGALRRVPVVGFFFQPHVAVGTFDGSAIQTPNFGMAATSLVNDALRRFAGDSLSAVNHIAVSTGAESASATVAKLGNLGSQFNALAAVMAFLGRAISTPVYQLSGTLQPDDGDGVGVTLILDRRSRAVDATTLRATGDATHVVAALCELSALAAAWVDYAMRKDELPDEFEFVSSPKSYAFFRLGVLRSLPGEGDPEAAYRTALEDGSNVGALLNLAELLRRKKNDASHREAVDRLDEARVAIDQLPEFMFKFIWYQVMYNRVAIRLGGDTMETDDRPKFLEDSVSMARRLGYIHPRFPIRLPRFPERQPFAALVEHYGLLQAIRRWRRPAARGFARFLFENAEPNAILFYLWDVHPNGGAVDRLSWPGRSGLKSRLDRVADAKNPADRYDAARGVVRDFVARRRPLSYRTKYNLACYNASRSTPDIPEARHWLIEALQDAPPAEMVWLANHALKDPTSLRSGWNCRRCWRRSALSPRTRRRAVTDSSAFIHRVKAWRNRPSSTPAPSAATPPVAGSGSAPAARHSGRSSRRS